MGLIALNSFIELSHMTKNTASGDIRLFMAVISIVSYIITHLLPSLISKKKAVSYPPNGVPL